MPDTKEQVTQLLAAHIPAPGELLKPLKINEKLLMIPGPTNMPERVVTAMASQTMSHMDPQFLTILQEISAGIRYVFQTNNPYSLAITGSGTCAMETTICNLLEKGDTFLVAIHGLWGQRAGNIGTRHGYNVAEVKVNQFGEVLTLAQIESALKQHSPKLLYVCHGDSSTGTLQPLAGIGELCQQYNCLLLVDAVVSLCCAPINVDKLKIDAIFSGTQKCLSGPCGASILSFSDRAVNVIKNRKTEVDSYYMDMTWLSKAWGIDNKNQFIYHYTTGVPLMYGLREALMIVVEQGLETVITRHMEGNAKIQKEVEQLGLKCLVSEASNRLPGILSVILPAGVADRDIIDYLSENYGILISGGLGPTAGQVLRIGCLGVNSNPSSVNLLCLALRESINYSRSKL